MQPTVVSYTVKQLSMSFMRRTALFISGLCASILLSLPALAEPPTVVIVIDDIGYSYELGKQAIALPGPINYAVLPHTQNGALLAELAFQNQKEILLHTPMSTTSGRYPGAGTLTAGLDKTRFLQQLDSNLASIPHVSGINNHMGSLLTQKPRPMRWLMEELKQRQLYFLDSRTSPLTIAQRQASLHNIPNTKRDVFLDNVRTPSAIRAQFERLLAIASSNGNAVAIGHPYPETLTVLKEVLPTLAIRGYQQKLMSDYLLSSQPSCPIKAPLDSYNHCKNNFSLAKLLENQATTTPVTSSTQIIN